MANSKSCRNSAPNSPGLTLWPRIRSVSTLPYSRKAAFSRMRGMSLKAPFSLRVKFSVPPASVPSSVITRGALVTVRCSSTRRPFRILCSERHSVSAVVAVPNVSMRLA